MYNKEIKRREETIREKYKIPVETDIRHMISFNCEDVLESDFASVIRNIKSETRPRCNSARGIISITCNINIGEVEVREFFIVWADYIDFESLDKNLFETDNCHVSIEELYGHIGIIVRYLFNDDIKGSDRQKSIKIFRDKTVGSKNILVYGLLYNEIYEAYDNFFFRVPKEDISTFKDMLSKISCEDEYIITIRGFIDKYDKVPMAFFE